MVLHSIKITIILIFFCKEFQKSWCWGRLKLFFYAPCRRPRSDFEMNNNNKWTVSLLIVFYFDVHVLMCCHGWVPNPLFFNSIKYTKKIPCRMTLSIVWFMVSFVNGWFSIRTMFFCCVRSSFRQWTCSIWELFVHEFLYHLFLTEVLPDKFVVSVKFVLVTFVLGIDLMRQALFSRFLRLLILLCCDNYL